jgi:fructose-1,6-bisphosphatase/inositol monophosphatase family enzyme
MPMHLTSEQQDFLIQTVRDAAREEILPRFQNLAEGDIAIKTSATDLVTLADTEAEARITGAINRALPGVLVIGEEAVSASPDLLEGIGAAESAIIIDPVDGTWNFAKGLGLFGVILAATRYGTPVFGLLYDPPGDNWIVAEKGGGARFVRADGRSRLLRTSDLDRLEDLSGYVPLNNLPKEKQAAMAATFPEFRRMMNLRCACHEYRMLAQGHADFVLSGAMNAWDHAAGSLVCQEAGGVSAMLDGSPYNAAMTEGYLLSAGCQGAWDRLQQRFAFLLE